MDTLSEEKTIQLLTEAKVGHLAVIADDVPYVSPVSYVVLEGTVYIRTVVGKRVRALRTNPKVCIEAARATENGGWECVIATGTASEMTDVQRSQAVIAALLEKYRDEIGSPLSQGARSPIPQPAIFVAIELSEISGRTSGSWFSIPTRPGRL